MSTFSENKTKQKIPAETSEVLKHYTLLERHWSLKVVVTKPILFDQCICKNEHRSKTRSDC